MVQKSVLNYSDQNMNGNQMKSGIAEGGTFRIGNGIDFKYTIKHGLKTDKIDVTGRLVASGSPVILTWRVIDLDNIEVSFAKVLPLNYIDIFVK